MGNTKAKLYKTAVINTFDVEIPYNMIVGVRYLSGTGPNKLFQCSRDGYPVIALHEYELKGFVL